MNATKNVHDMNTPELVCEFADHKVDGVLRNRSAEQHARLCEVVDELRERNVLD
jgi:hypothetical protein